ncbi:hypothetical protein FQV39_32255 (plasmid) [Bosea sp. F3-2]|uniref:hypothetical protein n=1 Tax=Bosea sp. F3-2 TaxID=2599640 RepID=UPI0011ED8CFE|nr:hypothetical protein [Bosea sp. F3-2]QEL27292.1 hypothetical protein FQV39_32255 [Bosea sp. F3-2]
MPYRKYSKEDPDFLRVAAELRARVGPLPATRLSPWLVDRKAVAAEYMVDYEMFARDIRPGAVALQEAAARVGTYVPLPPRANCLHSLADGIRICRAVARASGSIEQIRDHEVFEQLVRETYGIKSNAFPINVAMREALSKLEAHVTATEHALAVSRVRATMVRAELGLGCPADFANALVYESSLVGMAPAALSFLGSTTGCTIRAWGEGQKAVGEAQEPFINAIEAFLRLPKGALWNKLDRPGRRLNPRQMLREGQALSRVEEDKLSAELPREFRHASPEEKLKMLDQAKSQIRSRADTEMGKLAAQRTDRYGLRYEKWPDAAKADWRQYVIYRGHKVLDIGIISKKGLNQNSINLYKSRIEMIFGFLTCRKNELREIAGIDPREFENIPVDSLRLQLINESNYRLYLTWMIHRKKKFDRDAVLTAIDKSMMDEISLMWNGRR